MNPTEFRYRATFAKTEAMRYTGHLDLHRAWERMLRRARLPLAYSTGFHPHPQIQPGPALPLGITGAAELLEFWLMEEIPLETITRRLAEAEPPGIEMRQLQRMERTARHLDRDIEAGEYTAEPAEGQWPADLAARIAEFCARDSILRERRGKPYDLRPLVMELVLESTSLRMVLRLAPGATGRPEEVMAELGLGDALILMDRQGLVLAAYETEQNNEK
jgi:radical SAM-linked protein